LVPAGGALSPAVLLRVAASGGDGGGFQVGKHSSVDVHRDSSQVREACGKSLGLPLLRRHPQHSPENLNIGEYNKNLKPKVHRDANH